MRINDIGKREKRISLFLQFFKRTTQLGQGKVPLSTRARTLLCKIQTEQSRLLNLCGHGWGKEQEQRHKPKESEEKCLLITRNTKGGTNECDIRWEKGESKTNQKEEKDKKKDKLV